MSQQNQNKIKILLVDDEPSFLRALGISLKARGYDMELASDGTTALELAASKHPQAIVLDLGLPDIDGTDVVIALRAWSRIPIIVLSARDSEEAKVAALDAGADDYVTKPFSMNELLARLRASLRRAAPAKEAAVISTPHFNVDLMSKIITTSQGEVKMTPTEWHLVEALVINKDRLIPQRQLLKEVWGPEYEKETNYLRVFMAQIRRKLEPDPSNPCYFITEPGMGYRFTTPNISPDNNPSFE